MEKKQGKGSIVVLIIVAAAIVGVIAYGISQNSDKKTNNEKAVTETTSAETITTEPTTEKQTTAEPTTKKPKKKPIKKVKETEAETEIETEAESKQNVYENILKGHKFHYEDDYDEISLYFDEKGGVTYTEYGTITYHPYIVDDDVLTIYNVYDGEDTWDFSMEMDYDTGIAAHGAYYKLYLDGTEDCPFNGDWSSDVVA